MPDVARLSINQICVLPQWSLAQAIDGLARHGVPAISVWREKLHEIGKAWRQALRRRSQRGALTWRRMGSLIRDWLPKPHILHPWPSERFAVIHPRWEPYAGKPHVRFCAGGAQ